MKITIENTGIINGGAYTVDLDKRFEGYMPGDIICYSGPFIGIPLTLEFAIRADGTIAFRAWRWEKSGTYAHTRDTATHPTPAQSETVSGMFSGRIKVEGLQIAPGKTLQDLCPIDLAAEEERCGRKLYRA